MSRFGDRALVGAPGVDELRERRVGLVMVLAERFLHDLGIMLAGEVDGFDEYVSADTVRAVRGAVQPFLAGDAVLRPDFGEYAHLTIEGNLADTVAPVVAHVDFENRSQALRPDGTIIATPRRPLRLTLVLAADLRTVVGHRFDPAR